MLAGLVAFIACKKETRSFSTAENSNMALMSMAAFVSCDTCQIISFRGIRPDDINGRKPLPNPERGLRTEHMIKASDLSNPYFGFNYKNNLLSIIQNDESLYAEKVKLTQVYFYLTDYLGTDLPEKALSNMQIIFDGIEKAGYKIILLFAYRYNESCRYETYGDIKKHLLQLNSFLKKNESLIFVFQAGFLGLWGEWHHSGLDNSAVLKKIVLRDILQNIPQSRRVQVRETIYKANASGIIRISTQSPNYYPALSTEEYNRIGFHNSYFVLDHGPNSHWDYRWPDADYFMVQKEGVSTVVDGEMPYHGNDYGCFNQIAYGNQGGWHAIKRMKAHVYSSFSVVHNYPINIAAWKNQYVSRKQFVNAPIPIDDDYFMDQSGGNVSRTAYEYIRDHLGYRLKLIRATIPKSATRGQTANFSIDLKNYGFAPVINKRPVYLVLINENNQVYEFPVDADPIQWLPAHATGNRSYAINQNIELSNTLMPGHYKIGLWLPDDSDMLRYNNNYAIRFANGNMEWWKDAGNKYLINIIGSFELH